MEINPDSMGQFALLPGGMTTPGQSSRLETPYHTSQEAPSYLSVHSSNLQSFCRNREGWGPLSPYRFDFTPCFTDVWLATVAAFGILAGALAIWYLRKYAAQSVKKDWHFWTKMVSGGVRVMSSRD